MGVDKVTETLVTALKQALIEADEQRLYKSGKLAGLFPGRTGASGEAAARALRDGLIEISRRETKGKTVIDWARTTPRGVAFLHEHDTPERVLQALRAALHDARAEVPLWKAELLQSVQAMGQKLAEESRRFGERLDALGRRVEEALRMLAHNRPGVPEFLTTEVPWALDLLAYLERRRDDPQGCTLPELFTAVVALHPALSITDFHHGLRRLQEHRVVRLLPFRKPPEELPQPEYALLDGADVLYYATRWTYQPPPDPETHHALPEPGIASGPAADARRDDAGARADPGALREAAAGEVDRPGLPRNVVAVAEPGAPRLG
jgi:hypothetical protein